MRWEEQKATAKRTLSPVTARALLAVAGLWLSTVTSLRAVLTGLRVLLGSRATVLAVAVLAVAVLAVAVLAATVLVAAVLTTRALL
jgi:hypothetical protein